LNHHTPACCSSFLSFTKRANGYLSLIPDGTIKSAQLLRTPGYIQVSGTWDGTIVNIPLGDDGGEMDPHGPTGEGNPVGGNVTTNMVGGQDVFYEEWMSFVSDRHFCVRICTAVVDNIPTALMCEHELDIMGCNFVMAIPWGADEEGFTECDSEVAAPPGLYPQSDGSYSTFRQRFTGTWDGAVHTIGNTVTPSAPAFYPSSSNCRTWSTISNGVDTTDFVVRAAPTFLAGGGLSSGASVVSVASTSLASLAPVTTHTSEQTSSKAAVSPSASADASSGSTNKDDDKESSASKASGSPTSSAANPTGSSNAAASKSPLSVAAVLAAFGGVLLAVL
jgi:hypothetical protein